MTLPGRLLCRRRLRTVVASLALQSPGPSWCPGLGRLLASAALLCMAPGPGTDYCAVPTALRSPELSLASFKRQLKTHLSVPALDSAGCSCECRVPLSHRRCCDCTASSAPTTNVQTGLDATFCHTVCPRCRALQVREQLDRHARGPVGTRQPDDSLRQVHPAVPRHQVQEDHSDRRQQPPSGSQRCTTIGILTTFSNSSVLSFLRCLST